MRATMLPPPVPATPPVASDRPTEPGPPPDVWTDDAKEAWDEDGDVYPPEPEKEPSR